MTKTTVMTKCAPVGRWKDICLLAVIFFSLCSRVSSVDVLDGLQVEETDLNKNPPAAVGDVGLEAADQSKAPKLTSSTESPDSDEAEQHSKEKETVKANHPPFLHGFIASLSMIIISEIGDKTFFIAAILAMQHSKLLVFTGAILSLALMHSLSVLLGFAAIIIPRWITFYLGALLFAVFGAKMLWEGWRMSPEEEGEEFQEVSDTLKEQEMSQTKTDAEGGLLSSPPLRRRVWLLRLLPPVFFQAFTLTFVAEWGDRSQIAAIILAAKENPIGVLLGGILGHTICTGMAIIGGTLIAKRISVRTVTLVGGLVFLLFAVTTLFQDPSYQHTE
jgi:putative Ca2+/H+ antiporter (TMEM165/GDT1 family)